MQFIPLVGVPVQCYHHCIPYRYAGNDSFNELMIVVHRSVFPVHHFAEQHTYGKVADAAIMSAVARPL